MTGALVTKTEYNALAKSFSLEEIPKWNGKASVVVKDNKPSFSSDQKKTKKYPAIIDRKKNDECT